jgi:dTDP-4-dehydrorhamnose 3,5-epimerase
MQCIPQGCAHGLLASSERADVRYGVTNLHALLLYERTILGCDSKIGADRPVDTSPRLSGKDAATEQLRDMELFE